MSTKRERRREANDQWETNVTKSHTNGSGRRKDSEPHDTGPASGHGESNETGQTGNQNDHRPPRQSKGDATSKPKNNADLSPWIQAMSEATEGLGAARRTIINLETKLTTHINDAEMIEDNKKRFDEISEECRKKDEELEEQETIINGLRSRDEKAKAELDVEKKKLHEDKEELQRQAEELTKDRVKLTSRIKVVTAEEKERIDKENQNRAKEQDENHKTRMKELEAKFAQKSADNSKMASAIEDEKKQLSVKIEQQGKTIEDQAKNLEGFTLDLDVQKRATESMRAENQSLLKELKKMESAFAVNNEPVEYFEQKFEQIQNQIESISQKYFHDIEGKELVKVHDQLTTEDSNFESVPIDDSDDSRDLRTAHAQRIISNALCEVIWKPFNAEITSRHPEFSSFLATISENLRESSQDEKRGKVWAALTMRVLQSLPDDTVDSLVPKPKNSSSSLGTSTRADKVIVQVLKVLSPLISSTKTESIRMDLRTLVASAVEVWNNSQAGGLDIIIRPSLDVAKREEWRSLHFDLACDGDESNPDHLPQKNKEVFTLFPQILARVQDKPVPCDWPEPELKVINHGVGLPEWSPLVVRGCVDERERKDLIVQVLKNAEKERNSNKRISRHGKKESRGSSISGPPSSSEQLKIGGTK